jgi:hypothetical protein
MNTDFSHQLTKRPPLIPISCCYAEYPLVPLLASQLVIGGYRHVLCRWSGGKLVSDVTSRMFILSLTRMQFWNRSWRWLQMCTGWSASVRAGDPVDQGTADRHDPCTDGIRSSDRRDLHPVAGIMSRGRERRVPRIWQRVHGPVRGALLCLIDGYAGSVTDGLTGTRTDWATVQLSTREVTEI